ncbi:MAG: CPBP family intramembrane glutamic endopeptidase [Chloroflexota bacterium]
MFTNKSFTNRFPLITFFLLAFAGTWLVLSPWVFDTFGWIEIPDELGIILFILSTFTGPFFAAFYVTGKLEGKEGKKNLWRRIFQMRIGLVWYVAVLFTFLLVWLTAYNLLYRGSPLAALIANPALMVTAFLPNVLTGLLIPSLGEEPGWRGFALPRLQKDFGPVLGTLILGTLHGIWHLPALFTPLLGPFSWDSFLTFVLTAAAGTFIYTWVFNNTRGSVWIAILLHASSNAASSLVGSLIPEGVELTSWQSALDAGWLNVIAFSLAAVLLIIFTRGKLGYRPEQINS